MVSSAPIHSIAKKGGVLGNKSPQCPGPMAQALSKDAYPLPLTPVLLSKGVPMFKAARIVVDTYCY